MSDNKDLHFEYAKEILKKPAVEAEADLEAIRATKGDAEADAVISQFSAVMCELNQNQNQKEKFYE